MNTCCIAQGRLLNTQWRLEWEGSPKKRGYMCMCDFPGGANGKESTCNAGAAEGSGLIPGLGRSPGGGHSKLFQYSCLENPMDREAWWATVCGAAKSWTRLSEHTHISNLWA